MYGADPRLADLGSKTGCRRMSSSSASGAPSAPRTWPRSTTWSARWRCGSGTHAEGGDREDERGVSGSGNALVDLRGLPASGDPGEDAAARERVLGMAPEKTSMAVDTYLAAFEKGGGIARGADHRGGTDQPERPDEGRAGRPVELLSTHDQLLGGASGQSYLGCVFPADPAYATLIAEPAMVVGRHLAGAGGHRPLRGRLVTVRGRRRRLDGVRHRARPAQGRHHPSLPHAPVPDRRRLRRPRGAT